VIKTWRFVKEEEIMFKETLLATMASALANIARAAEVLPSAANNAA
jgi:hypothetical protein